MTEEFVGPVDRSEQFRDALCALLEFRQELDNYLETRPECQGKFPYGAWEEVIVSFYPYMTAFQEFTRIHEDGPPRQ